MPTRAINYDSPKLPEREPDEPEAEHELRIQLWRAWRDSRLEMQTVQSRFRIAAGVATVATITALVALATRSK